MAHITRYGLIFTALFLGAFRAYSMPANECLDDKKLGDIQAQSKRGAMVYVWSPRMVYSVQQMQIAARAAAANGLDFVVVHDVRVPEKELITLKSMPVVSSSREEIKLEEQDLATPPFLPIADSSVPLCAQILIERQALRHFPTAFIVTAQGVHRHPIVGAMPVGAWLSSIAQRLQQP
jgi:hypothetical protein